MYWQKLRASYFKLKSKYKPGSTGLWRVSFCGGLWVCAQLACAQFTSTSQHGLYRQITPTRDTVYVMTFNGITPTTDLSLQLSGTSVNWYKYSDPLTPISTGVSYLYAPDDATGYIVDVDGRKYNVWVMDYKNYLPVVAAISPSATQEDECTDLTLDINAAVPSFGYKTPAGTSYILTRQYTLRYATQKWTGDQLSGKWEQDSVSYSLNLPASSYTVKAPLCNTTFRLFGDQYASDLQTSFSFKSSVYNARAVEGKITTFVSSRDELNEADKPANAATISFSIPFDVEFSSNPTVLASYYKWEVYKDNKLVISRTDENQRYTFSEYGEYKVKSYVSNSNCTYTDSVAISARLGAALEAPLAFSPDGNGKNDEFRILYRSLLDFECWIYNRWGRLLYHWTDPQKGWDGRVGGKDVAEGVYFYVVKASGYGLDPKKSANVRSTVTKKGNVALFREHKD